MAGISPVANLSQKLTFYGEGQTFSTTPLLAPGRIMAFEATNLRTFRRTAAIEGGQLQNEEIRLKFALDPATGKIVAVGGESRAELVKEREISSNTPSYSPKENVNEQSQTPDKGLENAIRKLEQLENTLEQRLGKITFQLQQERSAPKNEHLKQEQVRLEQKLDTIKRVLAKVKNVDNNAPNDSVQKVMKNILLQFQKLTEKLLKILHPDHEAQKEEDVMNQPSRSQNQKAHWQNKQYQEEMSIPAGLLLNEIA